MSSYYISFVSFFVNFFLKKFVIVLFQAESLAKKYEEKYKLVADVASKLTIEEASFRDIQVKDFTLFIFYKNNNPTLYIITNLFVI